MTDRRDTEATLSRSTRVPLRVGVIGTIVWIALACLYAVFKFPAIVQLRPNELADLFAGASAPLAFLWIVVGYMHQSAELRLQVRELSCQVEASRQMANAASAEGARARRRVQPILVSDGGSGKGNVATDLRLRNMGAQATNVTLGETRGNLRLVPFSRSALPGGSTFTLRIERPDPGWFQIRYTDGHQEENALWFYYDGEFRVLPRPFGEGPLDEKAREEWMRQQP